MIIDVTDLPQELLNQGFSNAEGDGCTDDHEALQDLIDAKVGTLYFPTGRYRINSTLEFPNKTGYHVIGSGLAEHVGNQDFLGARAALVWGGDTNGTMVRVEGSGMIWNGLTLWGKHSDPDDCTPTVPNKKASVGLLIKQPSASSTLDTGMMWLPSIMAEDCTTAIKVEGTHGGRAARLASAT